MTRQHCPGKLCSLPSKVESLFSPAFFFVILYSRASLIVVLHVMLPFFLMIRFVLQPVMIFCMPMVSVHHVHAPEEHHHYHNHHHYTGHNLASLIAHGSPLHFRTPLLQIFFVLIPPLLNHLHLSFQFFCLQIQRIPLSTYGPPKPVLHLLKEMLQKVPAANFIKAVDYDDHELTGIRQGF